MTQEQKSLPPLWQQKTTPHGKRLQFDGIRDEGQVN
jgi:hypothetical protein